MTNEPAHQVTHLLAATGRGDSAARERLWNVVYTELHRMAAAQMAREAPGRTLQPTALVHEAYFRLFAGGDSSFANRRHFFAAAARAMQEIRVDDARRRGRLKRGGKVRVSPLDDEVAVFDQDPAEVLALDEALDQLEQEHPELAEVVRLRFFVGVTEEEAASVLGVAVRTIGNRWRIARAWLNDVLADKSG